MCPLIHVSIGFRVSSFSARVQPSHQEGGPKMRILLRKIAIQPRKGSIARQYNWYNWYIHTYVYIVEQHEKYVYIVSYSVYIFIYIRIYIRLFIYIYIISNVYTYTYIYTYICSLLASWYVILCIFVSFLLFPGQEEEGEEEKEVFFLLFLLWLL